MKRAKNIYIVRHGQSEGNVDDTVYQRKPDYALNLTPEGERQAIEAGQELYKELGAAYYAIYCSPYFRTKQTRFNIQKSLVPEYLKWSYEDPRLREQEWGNFQPNTTVGDYEEERDEFGRFFYRFEKGESGGDVYDRCSGFLETLYRDFNKGDCPDNIIIVGHGYTNRVLIARWLHLDFQTFERIDNPKNCEIIKLTTDENNKYKIDESYNMLRLIHETPWRYADEPNKNRPD